MPAYPRFVSRWPDRALGPALLTARFALGNMSPVLTLHRIDDVTVGLAIPGDCSHDELVDVDERLKAAAGRARCLILDMSRGPAAGPELARAVAWRIELARRRGYSVAIASPGPEVVRAIAAAGSSRAVELVSTVDEALARVRGRLTPARTIRVLEERQAA
jgi:hypothetical protein